MRLSRFLTWGQREAIVGCAPDIHDTNYIYIYMYIHKSLSLSLYLSLSIYIYTYMHLCLYMSYGFVRVALPVQRCLSNEASLVRVCVCVCVCVLAVSRITTASTATATATILIYHFIQPRGLICFMCHSFTVFFSVLSVSRGQGRDGEGLGA